MFDSDKWQEILAVIRHNKLRTILTGFSVAWGIFILVVLLGSGKGLENGIKSMWSDETNSIFLWGGQTQKGYKGFRAGRNIALDQTDIDVIKNNIREVKYITGNLNMWSTSNITRENKYANFRLTAVMPDDYYVSKYEMVKGRFISDADLQDSRKSIVINEYGKKLLFEEYEAIGEYIYINNIAFRVVGIIIDKQRFNRSRPMAFIPLSIGQKLQNEGNKVHQISVTLNDLTMLRSKMLETQIRNLLASKKQFDAEDKSAINMWNKFETFSRNMMMIFGIQLFVLLVGIGTIIAGIVGVSNIMIISVKERTKEIGIRKAIGAKPSAIIRQILSESVLITGISGYIGLLAGIGVMALVNKFLPPNDFFKNPDIDFRLALFSLLILIIAGLIAGYVPAKNAASIKPIEALRNE